MCTCHEAQWLVRSMQQIGEMPTLVNTYLAHTLQVKDTYLKEAQRRHTASFCFNRITKNVSFYFNSNMFDIN